MIASLDGVAIRAVSATVPTRVSRTDDYSGMTAADKVRFQKATGIQQRRIVIPGQCASDLCTTAAIHVLKKINWDPASIGMLILVTQTPDQPVPATALSIQSRLGLSNSCVAFDVNLGCSSYPYGLAIVSSMMKTMNIPRALLLIGDVSSLVCDVNDKSAWPLFGDAGSATALELDPNASSMVFDLMSDGGGKEAIIIPGGGLASKYPPTAPTEPREGEGRDSTRRRDQLVLRGADIFSFAISNVPSSIRRVMESAENSTDQVDYLVLHQANKMINDTIGRKVGFSEEKLLSSLEMFGNTSSASIPVTLCASSDRFAEAETNVILSGFGVGLSWGSVLTKLPVGSVTGLIESDHVY